MEREIQRKYPILETLSTEELEKLLAQDFAATGEEEPDVDYIMAIMGVIKEREMAAGHQNTVDVDAAWKDFQEEYQGQAAAFDRTIQRETESSDHLKIQPTQTPRKKTHTLRFVLVAAIIVVLLCGTATGFGRVFQAMVNWTAETFGFESPYEEESVDATEREDVYEKLRAAVTEYTDLPVVPKWAPEGTMKATDGGVKVTERKDVTKISGLYETENGRFTITIQVHNYTPPKYEFSYQWNEGQIIASHVVSGLSHDIVQNNKNNTAAWTNENVECMIQGDLSADELMQMIDSIYYEE